MNFLRFSRSSNLTQWRLNSRLKLKITMTLATLIILGGCGGSSDSSTGIIAEQPTELALAESNWRQPGGDPDLLRPFDGMGYRIESEAGVDSVDEGELVLLGSSTVRPPL